MTDKNTPCKCNYVPAQLSQTADVDVATLAKDLLWANAGYPQQAEFTGKAIDLLNKYSISTRLSPMQSECLSNGEE